MGVGLFFHLYGSGEGVEFWVGVDVWGVGEVGRGREGVGWACGEEEVGCISREGRGLRRSGEPVTCVVEDRSELCIAGVLALRSVTDGPLL